MQFKIIRLLYLSIIFVATLHAIDINDSTTNYEILSKSDIYVDDTHKIVKEQISNKKFIKNRKANMVPSHNQWVNFHLNFLKPTIYQ